MLKQAVFDIECNALEVRDVTKVWCLVIQDVETDEVFKYSLDKVQEGVNHLALYPRIIGHNIIAYDCPVLAKLHKFDYSGQVIDTLILSRLANPDRGMPWGMKGQQRPHSIEAWGWRLGKPKMEWDEWGEWHEGMLERCTQDVLINTDVYKALYHEFKE